MSHYDDLDLDIIAAGRPFTEQPLTAFDVAAFPAVLRKLAAPGEPRPDDNLMKYVADTQTGEAATPAEASARTAVGAPDDTGHLEGEFAVPMEQVIATLAQIVSNSMRQHAAYAYYGEMMRGLERAGLSELFEEQGEDELKEMHYFLRRMSVLQPGGVAIPPPPSPQPSDDPEVALRFLLAGEQQAIVLFKALHAQLGDNPMKYTLEQIQTDAQEHMDKLWQFMPQGAPEKRASSAGKVASVSQLVRKIAQRKFAEGPPVMPPPGAEPIESYLLRDQQLRLQQSEAEKMDMAARLQQAQQMAAQQQMAAEQAGAATQQASIQAEQASQAAAASQQQAAAATDAANQSQQMAAQQAEAKMRLSMRIQQLRQQLADIVSADPVAEELGGGQAAGSGAPATPGQQQQQQAEQEQANQLINEQQQAAATGGTRAQKEVAQAQKAEQNAQNQRQQAMLAEQGA